jgi:hypothetical protein
MATFKVIAGDFPVDVDGNFFAGRLFKEKVHGFHMPIKGKLFQTEHIPKTDIESVVVATEENLKSMGGAIGWGLVGGLALGGIGALAGILAGGRSKDVTFICKLKDGRKFMAKCKSQDFTTIQAGLF